MDNQESDTESRSLTNVRRNLAFLRQRWKDHSPTNPFCIVEELQPGLTVCDFCVSFLMSQRSRRTQVQDSAQLCSGKRRTGEGGQRS